MWITMCLSLTMYKCHLYFRLSTVRVTDTNNTQTIPINILPSYIMVTGISSKTSSRLVDNLMKENL